MGGGWVRGGARAFDLAVRCLGFDIGSISAAEAVAIRQSEKERRDLIESAIARFNGPVSAAIASLGQASATCSLRVCPETLCWIAKLSEHEAD